MRIDIDNAPLFVINLPERTERLERTRLELNKFFSCERSFEVVNGAKGSTHHEIVSNIAKAHIECVRRAKENKYPYVIICEDDVLFQSERSREHAEWCFADCPDDAEVLLGGVYSGMPEHHTDRWSTIPWFCALHFYVVMERAYDTILNFQEFGSHYDTWLGKNAKSYVASEMFAVQYDGEWSDQTNRVMVNFPCLREYKILK